MKTAAAGIVHKTDIGGVRLGITDKTGLETAYEEIIAATGDPNVVVQSMAPHGVELVAGLVRDPLFGPVLMAGSGGVLTDLLADRRSRVLPLTDLDAAEMARSRRQDPARTIPGPTRLVLTPPAGGCPEQGGMTRPDTTKVPSGWCVSALPGSRRAGEGRGDRTSSCGGRPTMKALVYNGPGQRNWDEVPEPMIVDPEDAIVRVDAVTICGTDLHILKGDVPTVDGGRVLGHEAVGTITDAGDGVRGVTSGDRVLISCISSCGRCEYCREGRYGQCLGGGGWILGHRIDGTQAEMVRVPFADRSMYKLPVNVSNESALLLADILPTAYEVGTLSGRVSPGDTVVIVGAGPIGLSAITTSKLFSPSRVVVVDVAASRQKAAMEHGADLALGPDEDVVETVRGFTNGLGADVAIEAVGVPATFELCTQVIRPGGRVANVGVHGAPATLHLEELWIKDVTITTGLVDTSSTPRLLSMLASGRLAMPGLITHRFGLDEMQDAYDVFSRAAETGALKVALFNEESPHNQSSGSSGHGQR